MSEHHHRHQQEPAAGEEFWDARYSESDRIWSGKPNAVLVREASDLAPGRALDIGCGEGADAVWLARRGWHVTGTDISGVALERAARHAEEAELADRTAWERHDLAKSFPAGEFDLVSACFLHSYGDFPRERILRTATAAVAPGGVLLIAGHAGGPSWDPDKHADIDFPTPEQVLAQLELPEGGWEVLLAEEYVHPMTDPDGRPGSRPDNALKVRRLR
ncbi:class I SAM-dependent methyltransferase [Streptomyces sp. NPDC059193]|uniref:class I SAM-dependent methyltransferase n=1 Tax=Streptomyces sp. NPDC059193 TaxID=3346763 RepID=UPI0036ADA8BA